MLPNKISPKTILKKMENQEDILLLDVRSEEKYNEYHMKGKTIECINIPKENIFKLEEETDFMFSLPKDKEIIITCTTGNSATRCANILTKKGFSVKVLDGGITTWKKLMNE